MRKIWDFHGGVHPPENKLQSVQSPIQAAGIPDELVFPLNQHIGAPAAPIVAVGERVLKGQKIADAVGFISAAVHASTSGTITAIEERPVAHPSGLCADCIVLASDGEDEWIDRRAVEDWRKMERAQLLEVVRNAGIVGMGGAGFPTTVKLGVNPRSGRIKTLIINGTECEPYITADDILMRERAGDIVRGTQILHHIIDPEEVLIGVEDNKPESIAALREAVVGSGFEVVVFPTKYPSGGEKQLIEILTGKQVPSGGLPADIDIVCQNVGTAVAVYRAVNFKEPLISRITTVTGRAVSEPRNFDVLLGTPMRFLLEQAGFEPDRCERLVMGGPMMGFTVTDFDVPVVKTTNCLLAPTSEELPQPPPAQPCIRCGLCAQACPAGLLPQQLYWFARGKEFEKLESHNLLDCIECGACSYACPSNIPLVQYYRASKAELAQLKRDQAKSEHSRTRFDARQERLQREAEEKEAKRKARKKAAEERARAAAESGEGALDPIAAAVERAKAKRAAAGDQPGAGTPGQKPVESPADAAQPGAAQPDAAQLAIERARAAKAANADSSPEAKAQANLKRLRERLEKSETKLAESRASDAEENVIQALEAAIEKLKPKLVQAEQEVAALNEGAAQPDAAQPDAAQLAIERARAARAANADSSPAEKTRANLKRLRERMDKSETKLAEGRAAGAEENIIQALEAAIEKLKPKLAQAEQEVAALDAGATRPGAVSPAAGDPAAGEPEA